MWTMSGRPDFGNATTAALLEELHDMLRDAERIEEVLHKRFTAEQRDEYADYNEYLDLFAARKDMRAYADLWHDRVEHEEVR